MKAVEVIDLEKSYSRSGAPALNGISLTVEPAEFLGLLGPNGAGKTTLLSIISTLRRPSRGTVLVQGCDVDRDPASVRRLIGLVPQNIALYPSLSARENLTFFGRMYGLAGRQLKERVGECLAIAGLEKSAERQVRTFSGGMLRRANLVAGLLHRPPILILDEPTVGIDPQSRNVIFESLRALNQAGATILYATHYMEEAEALCSRLAIIDRGRILKLGSPAQLIREQPGCRHLGELFLELTGHTLRDEV